MSILTKISRLKVGSLKLYIFKLHSKTILQQIPLLTHQPLALFFSTCYGGWLLIKYKIYIYSIHHNFTIVFPDTRNVKYLPIFSTVYLFIFCLVGDYFFPKKFEFVSLCSFICLQAVYQLSGPVCKATWNGCPSYSASYLHFKLCD